AEARHRHRVLDVAADPRGTGDDADRDRHQARLAGPSVLQAGPLRPRWTANRRLQVPDHDRMRERQRRRASAAQRCARHTRRPFPPPHVARRVGAGHRLSRRDLDGRRDAPARAVRPRVSPALVLAARYQDLDAHASARVSRQARVLTREVVDMKRHVCARRLGVCLVTGCVIVSYTPPGRADWEAVPDVTIKAKPNDNPALNSVGGTDTQVIDEASRLLADAVLRIRKVEPRGELSFEPRVRGDVYAEEEAKVLESTDFFLRSSGMQRGQTVRLGYSADLAQERIVGVEFLETLPTDPVTDDPSAVAT